MSKLDNSVVESRYELAKVALGEAEADLAIVNGDIVNVYTGEVLSGDTILIKGDKIAYAGKYAKRGIGIDTRIIDAAGKVLIPGFIDGHTHMDYICSSYEISRFAMKTGTTSIISETVEVASTLGYRGIIEFLKSTRDQPVKFWITIPPGITISPVGREHVLTLSEVRQLLKRREVLGLGESYWSPVINGDQRPLQIITETLKAGKKVEGHSAGAIANKLQAYASLGVTSCHEPITPDEALERLRLGMSVMIREGEIRQDLEAVSRIKDKPVSLRRLGVASDGVGPWQFTQQGFMDHIVQKAIDLGFAPVQAIQMATLNIAEHFNLDDIIGGIAPGRLADILIIPDLATIKPELVISNGQVVAQNGEVSVQPRRHTYPRYTYNSIYLDREFKAQDFTVHTDCDKATVKVRVIDQITHLLTKEAILELPVTDGQIQMDTSGGTIKVAAIERFHTPGKTFTGFIRGLGLKRGAIATSTGWDTSDITVAGANELDMALAVNRIKELHGGMVVCLDREIVAELAFPVGGIISPEPMEVLAEKLTRIQQAGMEMGCTSPDIRTTLSILTTGAIPYLRVCESGLFNLRLNRRVELVAE